MNYQNNTDNEENIFDKGSDNPTEKPGYYTYDESNKPKKKKSGFGKGFIVGFLVCLAAAAVAIVVINVVGIIQYRAGNTSSTGYEEKVDTIRSYLDRYYVGEIDEQTFTDYVAKGALAGIDDKYAAYYSEDEYKELMENVSGNYAGIGVSVVLNEDGLVEVYKIFEGTPAQEAGMQVGDLVTGVDGVTDFETLDDCVNLVHGEAGTSVVLTILRGDETFDLTVERQNIEIPTVSYKMLDGNIGYIQITQFEKATVDQFNNAIADLEAQGMSSLIMDLRDNPGGDYSTVVSMADRVLPQGKIIITEDKNGSTNTEYSDQENQLSLPMAILVNGNSASAAELFTGAIQDYGLATVIGEQTYGKGVVQSIFNLPDGSGMKFTTEKYYTPEGRDIDGVGITPDIVCELSEDAYEDGVLVEEKDNQLQKAIEVLSGNTAEE